MKRYFTKIFSGLILVFALLVAGCSAENFSMNIISKILPSDKYVETVKNGSMESHTNVKLGHAFDSFFSNTSWHSFQSTENIRVVEFNGDAMWEKKNAKFKFQFVVEGKKFRLNNVSINNVSQNMLVSAVIMDKILSENHAQNANNEQMPANETTDIPRVESIIDNNISNSNYPKAREALNFTDKKVIVMQNDTVISDEPFGKSIGHARKGITYGHLDTVETDRGVWQRIYIPDYGGAYLSSNNVKVFNKNKILGELVVNAQDVNIRSKATTGGGNKYIIGNYIKGTVFPYSGTITGDGIDWHIIIMPDGKNGYISSDFAILRNMEY